MLSLHAVVFCCLALFLTCRQVACVPSQTCVSDADQTCAHDVANHFLAIHDSVSLGTLDVVLLIDEGGLKAEQHYWSKQFVKMLADIFVIAPSYTKVSVITYSATARVIIPFTDNADVCSFTSNITSISFQSGNSYLQLGAEAAINEHKKHGRPGAKKLTVLLTNGGWGNLGSNPENSINTLKSLGYLAAVIMKHPKQNLGLISSVIFDEFVGFFGSQKLGFISEMSSEYLRDLQMTIRHNKAVGLDWPLDLTVDNAKCVASGRVCKATERCACEVRAMYNEYICIGQDQDPPEAIQCEGPPSIVQTGRAANQTYAQVTWSKPVFTDNSGIVNSNSNKLPGRYHVGVHNVITTAIDVNKNVATCSFSFNVVQ